MAQFLVESGYLLVSPADLLLNDLCVVLSKTETIQTNGVSNTRHDVLYYYDYGFYHLYLSCS